MYFLDFEYKILIISHLILALYACLSAYTLYGIIVICMYDK